MTRSDELSFHRFFKDTYPRVKAYLHTLLETNIHVDDIAQEVYIKLWNNWAGIDKTEPLEAYLFTMVRHMVISYFRKAKREKMQYPEAGPSHTPDTTHITDRQLLNDYALLYKEALQQTNEVKQRCFRLSKEEGLTYSEIARMEGLSVKTVQRYIQEVLQLLRVKFGLNSVNSVFVITLLASV